eukprot:301107-Chlamydomonas_euryale.AAC.1
MRGGCVDEYMRRTSNLKCLHFPLQTHMLQEPAEQADRSSGSAGCAYHFFRWFLEQEQVPSERYHTLAVAGVAQVLPPCLVCDQ